MGNRGADILHGQLGKDSIHGGLGELICCVYFKEEGRLWDSNV